MDWWKAKSMSELTPKQTGFALAIGLTIALLVYVIPDAYNNYGFGGAIVVLLAVGSIILSIAHYFGLLGKIRKMVLGEQNGIEDTF